MTQPQMIQLTILKYEYAVSLILQSGQPAQPATSSNHLYHLIQSQQGRSLLNELDSRVGHIQDTLKQVGVADASAQGVDRTFQQFGRFLTDRFLTGPMVAQLRALPPESDIALVTNMEPIPWELLFLDGEYLSLKHRVYRSSLLVRPAHPLPKRAVDKDRTMLIIANPTGDLNGAQREGNEIIDILARQADSDPDHFIYPNGIFSSQATRKNIDEALRPGTPDVAEEEIRIIHYAGHARPEGLAIAGDYLQGHELGVVSPDLVVLNACQTQSPLAEQGSDPHDDVSRSHNLIRNVLEAGARAVIGTFWDVVDGSTIDFTRLFYLNIFRDGLTIGESLLNTRRELYAQRPNDPIWASFVHYGVPEQAVYPFEVAREHPASTLALRFNPVSISEPLSSFEAHIEFDRLISDILDQIGQDYSCEIFRVSAYTVLLRFGHTPDSNFQSREAPAAALSILQITKAMSKNRLEAVIGIASGMVRAVYQSTNLNRPLRMNGNLDELALDLASLRVFGTGAIHVDAETFSQTGRYFVFEPWRRLEHGSDVVNWPPLYRLIKPLDEVFFKTPFFGRDKELGDLARFWSQADNHRSDAIGIVGPPGIGKTRLAVEFYSQLCASQPEVNFIRVGSQSHLPTSGFSVVGDLIKKLFQLDVDQPQTLRTGIRERLERSGFPATHLERAVDLIGYPLKVPMQIFEQIQPDKLKRELVRYLGRFLSNYSERSKSIILIDDLQRADLESLEILAGLIRTLQGRSILFLLLYRDEFEGELRTMIKQTLELIPLTRDESYGIVAYLLDGKPFPPQLLDSIYSKTSGTPLFLEEFIHALRNGELIQFDEDGQRWITDADRSLPAPRSLADIVLYRIGQLDSQTQLYADRAATIGPRFPHDLYLEWETTGMANYFDAATRLETLKIIQPGEAFSTYEFTHKVTRDILYERMSLRVRQSLHQLIADAIARHNASDPFDGPVPVADLALHYFFAGDSAKAWPLCLSLAREERDRSSLLMADEWYQKTLKMIDQELSYLTFRGEDHKSTNDGHPLHRQKVETTIERAEVLWRAGRFDQSARLLEDALNLPQIKSLEKAEIYLQMTQLADAKGDPGAAAETIQLGLKQLADRLPSIMLARLLIWDGLLRLRGGQPDAALGQCEAGLTLLDGLSDQDQAWRAARAMGLNLKGYALNISGQLEVARESFGEAIAIYEQLGSDGDLAGKERVYSNLGWVQFDLGDVEAARENLEMSRQLAEKSGEFTRLINALNNVGELERELENYSAARTLYKEALEMIGSWEMPLHKGVVLMNLGATYIGLDDLNAGEAYLLEGLDLLKVSDGRMYFREIYTYVVTLYQKRDALETVEQFAREATEYMRLFGDEDAVTYFKQFLE